MKVTDWRRKLITSLVAGGLMVPVAAEAADLNTNLVVDGSFENVDLGDTGPFDSARLNDWDDADLDGNATDDDFAFRFDQNYAGVNTPAGAGLRYFSGGFGTTVGQATISQSVNVSTGDTGTLIPMGEAAFNLSGFFSGYLTQADSSRVRLRFLNGSTELSRAEIGGFDFVQSLPLQPGMFGQHRDWGQDSLAGLIPVGTTSVSVEVVSDVSAGNHDGYVDLVDFNVVSAADILMFLEVNTATGQATIKNQTGEAIDIDYYEIVSAANALNATTWNSLQEQNLSGFPAGNGSGNGWEQAGGSDAGVLSESYLEGDSAVANSASVNLGAAYNVGVGAQDLVFRYSVVPPGAGDLDGDYDDSNLVSQGDLDLVLLNWGDAVPPTPPGWVNQVPTDGLVSQNELDGVLLNWGDAGGPSGPGALVTGFVRYVGGGAGAVAAVPEPSSAMLVSLGLSALAIGGWRKRDE